LNSSLDYEKFNDNGSSLVLGLFGLQIITQLSVFLVLFLTIADTFLFRVGLLDILLKKTRLVLFCQAVYLLLTILNGADRLQHSKGSNVLLTLITNETSLTLSIIQKICKFFILLLLNIHH
jgi:hypothetical protein